ncbi:uncharacterized protein BYT42DRAFT_501915 [Radiomyces spectabilis]|uniref:uncharacterized protein n=1 Tax=Radiomyces spectabilis TaxID=64574 RepID=UPI00221F8D9B|nr:uncharacterized protein BYT42DRAFT_501915 [Radiomyces spectabilis]KAI8371404.1 hypothetical protein BYT42DRAFT_501915 [Radiomyces spectabilis]
MKKKTNTTSYKKMKNSDLLSAGAKVYAKKRKRASERVESVEFDFDKRKATEARAERQRLADKNVAEIAAMLRGNQESGDEEEETVFSDNDEGEKEAKKPKVQEFKSKAALTTVTVIEDLDLENV